MPKVDNNSFVLSDFISFSITGIARTAYLQNILHCTMRYCQLPYHYIVTKIMMLMGIYRDSSLCLYCDAISAKTRQENYLMGARRSAALLFLERTLRSLLPAKLRRWSFAEAVN
jgi:hypothetical protein